MNNNTIQNNGNQFFQENNFYSHDQVCCKTNDCISSVTKMAKFSSTVIITVVGFVADLLAIGISFKELKIEDIYDLNSLKILFLMLSIIAFFLLCT